MKKRSIKSLALNKSSISQLQNMIGGFSDVDSDGPTMSDCSCKSCAENCNTQTASTLGCTE
ncbi:hypothetical protein KORDIASMS9_02511 [Kordia sp. SMS9]|uniref:hypothetical protein n=1 Tax=Kordia sp. SMS9 TaxID=2282170 RepID=UPI000E0CF001|nr:hypothetical protein [Kordia sp. SMS9]AXG70272.1 hypothetical protein KORDIASMS9_02511 [Kordia sp. SMS9]